MSDRDIQSNILNICKQKGGLINEYICFLQPAPQLESDQGSERHRRRIQEGGKFLKRTSQNSKNIQNVCPYLNKSLGNVSGSKYLQLY